MDRVDAAALRRFLAGDVLAILAFVVAGQFEHGVPPHQFPFRFAATAGAFLVGWVVAAPLAGAYARTTLDSLRAALGRALLAWLAADVVAQLLRETVTPGSGSPAFFAVAAVFGGVLLVSWRVAAVLFARRLGTPVAAP